MSDLLELAARCEAAEVSEQRDLILLAWDTNNPAPPTSVEDARGEWSYARRCLTALLDLGGFTDAAMTLKEGILITLSEIKGDGMPMCVIGNPATAELYEATAATPALALCAAALRARAAQ